MSFNLEEWKEMGRGALKGLEELSAELKGRLEKIETEKREIRLSMGMPVDDTDSPTTAKTRVRLRPAIMGILGHIKVGNPMPITDLVSQIVRDIKGATEESVGISLRRALAQSTLYEIVGKEVAKRA